MHTYGLNWTRILHPEFPQTPGHGSIAESIIFQEVSRYHLRGSQSGDDWKPCGGECSRPNIYRLLALHMGGLLTSMQLACTVMHVFPGVAAGTTSGTARGMPITDRLWGGPGPVLALREIPQRELRRTGHLDAWLERPDLSYNSQGFSPVSLVPSCSLGPGNWLWITIPLRTRSLYLTRLPRLLSAGTSTSGPAPQSTTASLRPRVLWLN